MHERDLTHDLQAQVQDASADQTPLKIVGGDSKSFLGNTTQGERLEVGAHRGIVTYEPTELVITARSGTPLNDIEALLAENNQMLAFEPPYYGESATLGGTIACNLSGPRRAYAGAARDFVLGTRLINGRGEVLHFGGEVMKNVAGYDVSRLMAGAMGTLGVLLEVSLKVLPRPEYETTLVQTLDAQTALNIMHDWSRHTYPISATCFYGERLMVRLCGAEGGVKAAVKKIGGDIMADAGDFWRQIKEQRKSFFSDDKPLWRLSIASDTPPLEIGKSLYEWNGALRWLKSNQSGDTIRQVAGQAGGHATLYRGGAGNATDSVFQPLAPGLFNVHRQLKKAFDPESIFNPGRLYQGL